MYILTQVHFLLFPLWIVFRHFFIFYVPFLKEEFGIVQGLMLKQSIFHIGVDVVVDVIGLDIVDAYFLEL